MNLQNRICMEKCTQRPHLLANLVILPQLNKNSEISEQKSVKPVPGISLPVPYLPCLHAVQTDPSSLPTTKLLTSLLGKVMQVTATALDCLCCNSMLSCWQMLKKKKKKSNQQKKEEKDFVEQQFSQCLKLQILPSNFAIY